MPSSTCSFCARHNPEGSRFCNECGSPLNLVPCPSCDAINNIADDRCNRCGQPLSEAAVHAVAEGPPAYFETPQQAQIGAISAGAVPVALAERLEAQPWAAAPSDDPPTVVAEPTLATTAADDDAGDPVELLRPRPWDARANFNAGNPGRAKRIFLGVALVAIVAGLYWSWHPRQSSNPEPVMSAVPPARQEPAARAAPAPPQPPEAPSEARVSTSPPAPTTTEAQPATTSEPAATRSVEAPANAQDASPPQANVSPSPNEPPKAVEASPPAPAQASTASERTTAAKSEARSVDDVRRRPNPLVRTREQAERDALATRRLIERDLGVAPGGGSTSTP